MYIAPPSTLLIVVLKIVSVNVKFSFDNYASINKHPPFENDELDNDVVVL